MLEKGIFSNTTIKLFAILFMFIDHFAVAVYSNLEYYSYDLYIIMRLIGRIAFPLFAFLLVEGFHYTRNKKLYLTRLSIFALLAEVPFDLALYDHMFYLGHQNIFITLAFSLIALMLYEKFKNQDNSISYLFVLGIGFLASIINADYGLFGVLSIFLLYYYRGNFNGLAISLTLVNLFMVNFDFSHVDSFSDFLANILQVFSILALIFIFYYNQKQGIRLKYFFYLFYPLHLLLLYFIRLGMI